MQSIWNDAETPESLPSSIADIIAAEDASMDIEGYHEMVSVLINFAINLFFFSHICLYALL